MITKFGSLYAGHVDLDNLGFDGTPVNDRWLSDDQLATVFDKTEAGGRPRRPQSLSSARSAETLWAAATSAVPVRRDPPDCPGPVGRLPAGRDAGLLPSSGVERLTGHSSTPTAGQLRFWIARSYGRDWEGTERAESAGIGACDLPRAVTIVCP